MEKAVEVTNGEAAGDNEKHEKYEGSEDSGGKDVEVMPDAVVEDEREKTNYAAEHEGALEWDEENDGFTMSFWED
jgi:hypothetical protein